MLCVRAHVCVRDWGANVLAVAAVYSCSASSPSSSVDYGEECCVRKRCCMCVYVCVYMFVAVCAQGRVRLRVYFQSMNVNEMFSSQTAAGNWLQLCRSYRATASGSLSTHTHTLIYTHADTKCDFLLFVHLGKSQLTAGLMLKMYLNKSRLFSVIKT